MVNLFSQLTNSIFTFAISEKDIFPVFMVTNQQFHVKKKAAFQWSLRKIVFCFQRYICYRRIPFSQCFKVENNIFWTVTVKTSRKTMVGGWANSSFGKSFTSRAGYPGSNTSWVLTWVTPMHEWEGKRLLAVKVILHFGKSSASHAGDSNPSWY